MSGEQTPETELDPAESFVLRYLYKPKHAEILYHYCSMEAFEAILRARKLRVSDINMMSDFAEMRWGYQIFEEAASTILHDRQNDLKLPDRPFFDEIDRFLSPANLFVHPLIGCFSRNPDVLSQWRGYARNGTGVALGFDAAKLCRIAATFLNCEYDREKQVEQMRARLLAGYALRDEYSPAQHAVHLFGYLPSLKNPAFREEDEVRAVHLLNVRIEEDGLELVDPGGEAFGKPADACPVEFNIRDDAVVAYVDLPYSEQESDDVIAEVVLGPKNPNAPTNIWALLTRHGHRNVKIRRSTASYR